MTNIPQTLAEGTILDGYTVGTEISNRTGARSYRASADDGVDVCVTLYAPACFPSALVRERSLRELRQLMTVQSPYLLKIVGVGKLDDGGIYEITEHVAGPTLDESAEAKSPEATTKILSEVGHALLAAQKVGVIHRNLSPSVIFDTGSGVKVGGYAVAEPQGGQSYGPLATIAPEQVAGKVVDQRSMIYNLAALGHRLLTGANLFAGNADQVLQQHLEAEVPDGVSPVLVKALAKDPRRRPMMLKQFLDELMALAPGAAVVAPASSPSAAASKPSTRGWTQFMDETDAGSSSDDAGSPAATGPSTPSKPTTRGWTMFMEASEAESDDSSAGSNTPAGGRPTTGAGGKPKTRGWTMFMDAPEDEEESNAPASTAERGGEEASTPAVSASSSVPSAPPTGTKPKTRGWTMFMEGEESDSSSAPSPAESSSKTADVRKTAQMFAPGPMGSTASNASAAAGKSTASAGSAAAPPRAGTTRGWTMFMEAPLPKKSSAGVAAKGAGSFLPPRGADASPSSTTGDAPVAKSETVKPVTKSDDATKPVQEPVRSVSDGAVASAPGNISGRTMVMNVAGGIPKPDADPKSAAPSGADDASEPDSVVRGKTMMMGPGLQAVPLPKEMTAADFGTRQTMLQDAPPTADSNLSSDEESAEDEHSARPSSAADVRPIPTPSVPRPGSPAPVAANSGWSLMQIALGAAAVGVVLAGIVMVIAYFTGGEG